MELTQGNVPDGNSLYRQNSVLIDARKTIRLITLVGISFWLLFCCALFGGDAFWGMDFTSFLGSSLRTIIFRVSVLFLSVSHRFYRVD